MEQDNSNGSFNRLENPISFANGKELEILVVT